MDTNMATVSTFQKIDVEHVAECLQSLGEKLGAGNGETILDFSAVRKIDPITLRALTQLADAAEINGTRITLRAVNVEIYKVLKLVKLAPRFVFLT
jgi:anti-anti-sigma regulatory factor